MFVDIIWIDAILLVKEEETMSGQYNHQVKKWAGNLESKLNSRSKEEALKEALQYRHQRYGLSTITLTGLHGLAVKVKPQGGATTAEGAKWWRRGMRDGFIGFTMVSPTQKYSADYEAGHAEGLKWFERYEQSNPSVQIVTSEKV